MAKGDHLLDERHCKAYTMIALYRLMMAAGKLRELKNLSWESLKSLPSMSQRECILGGERWIESVWIDALPDDELRIVVQLYKPGFVGTGQVQAEGFKTRSSGEILELSESELFDFL